MSLDHLPPELLSLILQSTDSPLDLYRLISAAPSCLRAFSLSPQLVLSSVIQNAFPGNNIRHALAILQAPSTKDEVTAFLSDRYFNPAASFDFPTTREGILSLYNLYNRCWYVSNGYLERTLQELGIPGQPPSVLTGGEEKQSNPLRRNAAGLLSLSERTRIQRAFLRFFLYCQVFPGRDDDPYGPEHYLPPRHTAHEQFSLFLEHLTPWEVEEICCVEQYLSSLVGEFIDELEEDLISAVIAAPGAVLPPSPSTSHSEPEALSAQKKNEQDLVEFKSLDLTDLLLFCRDGRYSLPRYISYMTSKGLDAMYSAKSDKRKRVELIRSNHPVTREFLPEALGAARRRRTDEPQNNDDAAGQDVVSDDDDASHANLGYRLFNMAPKSVIYMTISDSDFRYSRFRELGYVFWDRDRIQSPEVLKKFSAAKAMTDQELDQRFDRIYRKTAEDRLKGTRLPREEMERLEREFGTTLLGAD